MQSTFNLVSFVAGVIIAFGFASTALAYTDLEVEIDIYDNGAEVEASYVNADDEDVEKEYTTDLTDEDEIVAELVEMLDDEEIDAEAITSSEEYDVETYEGEELTTEEDEEESSEEEAADAIQDAEEEIAKAELVIEDAEEDGKETELSSTTLAEAKELLADAQAAFDAGDYEEAEDLAEEAEDLAQLARMKYIDKTEDDISDDDDDSDFCDRTQKAAGWGVAKKCVDNDDWEVNDKLADKVTRFQDMKNFGKTTDRAELQSQLRSLLELLIELLSAQMALKAGA